MSKYTVLRTLVVAVMAALVPVHAATRTSLPRIADGGFADIVEKALPSVVRILVTSPGPRGQAAGEGSGVIVSEDGYVLTNRHVVAGASKIMVQLHDDREVTARLIAADEATDMAVLKVDAPPLRAIVMGDSDRVRIGDYALAVGNPFGVGTTVTLGIVSAKGEYDYIQTDAAINPGNSGGPLLNTSGELIGINTALVSPSGGSSGVGFALPSNVARAVMTDLLTKGRVERGYLGVGFQPITQSLQEALGVRRGGAVISDVATGSPAERSGLKKGDVVVAINGRPLRDFRKLQLHSALAKPRTALELTIARQDSEIGVSVMLAERPEPVAAFVQEEVLAGVTLADGLSGAEGPVVMAVDPQCPSAEVGLRPGDVIVAADRKPIAGTAGLREQLAGTRDKPLLLEISRGGSTYFVALPRL